MAWKLSQATAPATPVGSGRTLNDGQAARLRTILDEKSPEEVGIASPLWTRRAVAELIRKEYGIDMPVRTVGEYLERWGYTAKVPRRACQGSGPRGSPPLAGGHLSGDQSAAAREDAEIHWCDETGAAADQQPRRGYAREGRPARIEVPDPHIRMNLISTISNEGSVHFMTYKETMTAALFITFLERMLSETTRKIFLIVDRLRAHEAKKVEASGRGASGSDRVILPATVRPRAECGRVPEQRHEGVDQRDWPAGESRGVSHRGSRGS